MVSVLNKITGVFTIIVEGATKHFGHWHLDFLTLTLGGKENEFLFTSLRIFSVWRNAIVNMQFKLHSTSSVFLFPVISFENYFYTVLYCLYQYSIAKTQPDHTLLTETMNISFCSFRTCRSWSKQSRCSDIQRFCPSNHITVLQYKKVLLVNDDNCIIILSCILDKTFI